MAYREKRRFSRKRGLNCASKVSSTGIYRIISDGSTENSMVTPGSTVPEPSISKAFEDLNRVMKRPKSKKKNKKKKVVPAEEPKPEVSEPAQMPAPASPRVSANNLIC